MFLIAKIVMPVRCPDLTRRVLCNRDNDPARLPAFVRIHAYAVGRVPAWRSDFVALGDPPAADALNAVLCHAARGKLEAASIPPISDGQWLLPVWNKERVAFLHLAKRKLRWPT